MKNKPQFSSAVRAPACALIIAAFVALAGVALAKGPPANPAKPSGNVSTRAIDWGYGKYLLDYNPHPTPSIMPFGFTIPQGDSSGADFVAYFVTQYTSRITQPNLAIGMTVTADPGVTFNANLEPGNTCSFYPAIAVPYIRRAGTDTGNNNWYAVPYRVSLADAANQGAIALTVPMTGSNWMNANGVMGDVATAAFAATLNQPAHVGVIFGGGCWPTAHGVNATGPSQFALNSFGFR